MAIASSDAAMRDDHADPGAPDHLGEDVAAEVVGAEPVRPDGGCSTWSPYPLG